MKIAKQTNDDKSKKEVRWLQQRERILLEQRL